MSQPGEKNWKGPLQGITVLDFTRVLAGPSASLALADMGAEVIKIEPPGTGDETRTFPPFKNNESHYYLSVNRGKKSIVIDLKSPEGVALVKELVVKSDILIENYRPGVMERLGLGYQTLKPLNPGLIYCAISGFGLSGPLKDRPSFDIVLQALSGALSVNGEPDGLPTKLGIPLGDLVGGINGPIGILSALYERSVTGVGRLIDVSLLDGMVGMLGYLAQLAFFTGEDPQRQGSQHPNLVPYGVFAAQDGSIIIACLTNSFWGRVCQAIGRPELECDERYNSLEKRREQRTVVNEIVTRFTEQHTVSYLIELFTELEVPHAPILGVQEALQQPQIQQRDMVVQVNHKTLGDIPIINRPIKLPESTQPTPSAPATLGEHTDFILQTVLNKSEQEINQLKLNKTVY